MSNLWMWLQLWGLIAALFAIAIFEELAQC